jgi:hypothetical protein
MRATNRQDTHKIKNKYMKETDGNAQGLAVEANPNEEHIVKILKTEYVTHNVKRFTLSKPDAYKFKPGQATDIVINLPEWKEKRRPFTFTSLNEWDHL